MVTPLSQDRVIEIIQECFDSLKRSGVTKEHVKVSQDTVLLGSGSSLDSIGFVSFISDMEDRLTEATGIDVFFVLNDIQEFNINQPYLSAGSFANYVRALVTKTL